MRHVDYRLIYTPHKNRPMWVVVFASGGGGNLRAAIDLSVEKPRLIRVGLVVTDRLNIPAIDIAENYGIPVIARDFEGECGVWSKCRLDRKRANNYERAAVRFHNRVLKEVVSIEKRKGVQFDLAVLCYHRWIRGDLLKYFHERMINQHAGDLTVTHYGNTGNRYYIGINPVWKALRAGEVRTRTSTFIVRAGEDNGEILCQGPWVNYEGPKTVTRETAWEHELIQKRRSDWPSLRFALTEIAQGYFGLATDCFHGDGCKIVFHKGIPLPYGGVSIL